MPERVSPSFGWHSVVCVVVVPTLATLLISLATDKERALPDFEVPCMPAVADRLAPIPANPACASAVTDAFHPLESDEERLAALF